MGRNLVEGLLDEMNRCRELLKDYEQIGPAGMFGHAAITEAIRNGEKALGGGDIAEMVAAFKALQSCG
jgi:hypothetical protein